MATDGAKKKKTMKVYSYFMPYKKHSQHVSQYLDNNYIILKVATRSQHEFSQILGFHELKKRI
jgi:hypothetical protein